MMTADQACDHCARLIALATQAGADAADAVASSSASESVDVRLGKLEGVERSEGEEIGLRVFVGGKSASISTSDFSSLALAELSDRAVAMARLAPDDPYAGLAPKELLGRAPFQDLELADDVEPTPSELRERALAAEDSALAVPGVTNSAGASAGFTQSIVALVTSHGFSAGYNSTSHSLSASMIAGEGEDMQRDNAYRIARHLEDVPPVAEIGRIAGERAVARMNPRTLASGQTCVVFDPRAGSSLIGNLLGAMSGAAAARRSTFLLDRLQDQIFGSAITIRDNPHIARGVRSKPFEGEGLPTNPRDLVAGGRVTGWLLNTASARQLNLPLTGHAARTGSGAPGIAATNVHLEPGAVTVEQLIADIDEGVLVNELIGQGVNITTGDYSRGASGFAIRGGELAEPVSDFTIAGNLIDIFAALTPANDLEMFRAINVPTFSVGKMSIAGK